MPAESTWEELFETLKELGFEQVWSKTFDDGEEMVIAAHRADGILLWSDSSTRCKIKYTDRMHLYMHCRIESWETFDKVLTYSTKGPSGDAWAVTTLEADSVDELTLSLANLRSFGRFVAPWPEPQFLWLLAYQEGKCVVPKNSQGYTQATRDRLALLPDWVQAFVVMH